MIDIAVGICDFSILFLFHPTSPFASEADSCSSSSRVKHEIAPTQSDCKIHKYADIRPSLSMSPGTRFTLVSRPFAVSGKQAEQAGKKGGEVSRSRRRLFRAKFTWQTPSLSACVCSAHTGLPPSLFPPPAHPLLAISFAVKLRVSLFVFPIPVSSCVSNLTCRFYT